MKKPYIIIYEFAFDRLEDRVAKAMEQGYKPHGSLVFRPRQLKSDSEFNADLDKLAFIQPMVLKN